MTATVRAGTAATATLNPSSPASTQVGDLVLVITWTRADAGVPTHTLQSGFTEIRTHAHDDADTDGRLSCAYKVATGAGASGYQAYTSSGGTADYSGIVVLTAGTYDNRTGFIGDVNTSNTQTNNAQPDPTSIVTPQAQCLVLAIGAWRLGSALTATIGAPTNYTEVWEMAGSASAELSVAQRTVAAAGTEDPANFTDDVAPTGSATMVIAFRPVNLSATLDLGTYALTGVAVGIEPATSLDLGTYALTGVDLAFVLNTPVNLDLGTYALTGVDVGLLLEEGNLSLTADVGAYDLTGVALGLDMATPLDVGTYAMTGVDMSPDRGFRIDLDAGSFAMTGVDVSLEGSWNSLSVDLDAGSFAVTGVDVALDRGFRIDMDAGSYVLTGNDLTFENDDAAGPGWWHMWLGLGLRL